MWYIYLCIYLYTHDITPFYKRWCVRSLFPVEWYPVGNRMAQSDDCINPIFLALCFKSNRQLCESQSTVWPLIVPLRSKSITLYLAIIQTFLTVRRENICLAVYNEGMISILHTIVKLLSVCKRVSNPG